MCGQRRDNVNDTRNPQLAINTMSRSRGRVGDNTAMFRTLTTERDEAVNTLKAHMDHCDGKAHIAEIEKLKAENKFSNEEFGMRIRELAAANEELQNERDVLTKEARPPCARLSPLTSSSLPTVKQRKMRAVPLVCRSWSSGNFSPLFRDWRKRMRD